MADFGDTIPYTVGNNTLDLSRQLEKQLDEQLVDDNFGSVGENNVQQEVKAPGTFTYSGNSCGESDKRREIKQG